MPRVIWRRRRATDSPRPAGRQWTGRLRAGGSKARQMLLVPVGRWRRTRVTEQAQPGLTRTLPIRGRQRDGSPSGSRRIVSGLDTAEMRAIEVAASSPEAAPATAASIPLLPGDRSISRRLKFGLVQACTLSSLLLGMTAIFFAVGGHDPKLGALCLLGCIVFDGLDGGLARKFGVASPFGVQMDSLGDMTSFGIAAPVVVYSALAGSIANPVLIFACALVAACAAVRLARFNVSPKDGRFFCGVPTTMAATVLAISVLIGLSLPAGVQVFGIVLLAVAMVSSFPYAKLARVATLPPWLLVLPLIGLVTNLQLTFGLIVLGYLLSGPLLWLHQRRASAT